MVLEYYDAINSRDYPKAWALGGDHLSSNYADYVQGYSGTASVTVTILSTTGNTVEVDIAATQDNGAVASYQGTYTVNNGVITSADIQGGLCDLSLTEGQGRGATGHYVEVFIYTNIGQVTCQVFGYASLQFYDSSGLVPATVNHGSSFFQGFSVAPQSFALSPGQQASFDIGGADSNNVAQTACPSASVLVTTPPVTPATGDGVQVAQISVPVCPGGTDESPVVAGSAGPPL